ncbi:alpha-1,4-glucan--maltose-1-phosphate maltosyltransferase [soil metagenome]
MKAETNKSHVVIERVSPELDCARYRAKAIVGDVVEVSADIVRDGPDLLQASVRFKGPSDARWSAAPMTHAGNDRWSGTFTPAEVGRYRYTIEAWTDHFSTWRRALIRRVEAGQEIGLELEEGALLLEDRLRLLPAAGRRMVQRAVDIIRTLPAEAVSEAGDDPRVSAATDETLAELTLRYPDRSRSSTYRPVLEITVDRDRARFGAWYELFPRSTGTATEHGTFATAAKTLPRIADMGFDVVYLPPIHPIGRAFRKGKNNSLQAEPDDVGVPWAIGGPEGGHTAVHPQLGSVDDFDDFVAEAARHDLEIALDFAIQCSPDHPWVTEHPEWFHHRPDGTIKYAENPPKKYQDVYPINFDTDNKLELWTELKRFVDFWMAHGVKIFRVDNPHTKPFPFWQWLIDTVQESHPEVIFLAEAFTRPKVMRTLAKLGFTQSYTYFTWRNTKWELTEYLTELTQTEMAHYFRPNFFTNTQDILHEYLQSGGPPAFKIRFVLAALLSPTYGIYSGFELFENVPREHGSEEYLNSEKYELRPRDWNEPNNLAPYIKRINEIRNDHGALSRLTNLTWHSADKDHILAFSKATPGAGAILVVVNLNPFHWEEATLHLQLDALGVDPFHPFEVSDLVTGATFAWHGPYNYVRLDPSIEPAHIFEVR